MAPKPESTSPGSGRRKGRLALAALALTGVVVAVVVSGGSGGSGGSSSTPTTRPPGGYTAAALPVPTNRVTGNGSASVQLHGNVATVTLDTNGLLNGSPHAMHIHAGGKGLCPPASTARLHNGHRTISTTDGIKFYGPPQVSLTTGGDTSAASRVDFSRYPAVGNIRYERADILLTPGVANAIRAGDAVIVVHGIDYNGNHIYDDVLDRSELNSSLPGEATAPALCGPLAKPKASADAHSSATTFMASLHVFHESVSPELPGRSHLAAVRAGRPRPAGDRAIRGGARRPPLSVPSQAKQACLTAASEDPDRLTQAGSRRAVQQDRGAIAPARTARPAGKASPRAQVQGRGPAEVAGRSTGQPEDSQSARFDRRAQRRLPHPPPP